MTIENGREIATREMKSIKQSPTSRYGKALTRELAVRVEPANERPLAKMKTPDSKAYWLSTGARVQVKYDSKNKQVVTSDEEPHAIQARNPQLKPAEWQGWLDELFKKEMGR